MSEQTDLTALGVVGEWIWGDDAEECVFAQAYGMSKTIIFRFTLDKRELDSLASRIVRCYHEFDNLKTNTSFANRTAMLTSLWSIVACVWANCCQLRQINDPDTIVDVFSPDSWEICKEILFIGFLRSLPALDSISIPAATDTIDFRNLVRLQQLGGRGCATLVHVQGKPDEKFLFKGVDFRTFLYGYESGRFELEVDLFTHSIAVLNRMPRHLHIIAPPNIRIAFTDPTSNDRALCGVLFPFYENGSLVSRIEISNAKDERISLALKAKWCCQMAKAVFHTHRVAQTFHMDIKPGSFILDENLDLLLIDWEQGDTPVTTAAPEIDGTWDATAGASPGDPPVYTKYKGPPRRNMPEATAGNNGWNTWNSFLEWQEGCPEASERAEVFSLGRTMWMLLRQYEAEELEDVETTEDVVEDWNSCQDIPTTWRDAVESCLDRDPRNRPLLDHVVGFWIKAMAN